MTDMVNLFGLLAAAIFGGGAAALASRWMLTRQASWRSWLGWLPVSSAVVGGLLLLAMAWQPVHLLWGEQPHAQWWLWLRAMTLGALWLSVMVVIAGGIDRLVHHHAIDAGQAMKHLAWAAVPSSLVAMVVLLWLLPLLTGRDGASMLGGLFASLSLLLLIVVISTHVMLLASMIGLPGESEHRRPLWLMLGLFLLPVQAMASFVLLCVTMLALGMTGQPMQVMLGMGDPAGFGATDEVSLAALAWRWAWLSTAVLLATAAGAGFIFKAMRTPEHSLRRIASTQGPITWRHAQEEASTVSASVFADLHNHLPGGTSSASTDTTEENATSPDAQAQTTAATDASRSPSQQQAAPTTSPATSSSKAARAVVTTSSAAANETSSDEYWLDRLAGVFPTRGHYVLLAIVVGAFMFYASLIPMEYRPLAWEEAVKRFRYIQFYKLGIGRRADLIANLVLMVPVAYLMMAAICSFTTRWWGRLLTSLGVMAAASAYVVAIEFTQQWFPPRTVSLNDIQAGIAGAAAGITLWLAAGDYVTYIARQACARRGSAIALQSVSLLVIVGMLVYSLFPLDFTFDPRELAKKYEQGRVVLVPFLQGVDRWYWTLAIIARDMLMFVPAGLLLASLSRTKWRWMNQVQVVGVMITLAVILEAMRLPVFTAHSGSEHIIARALGGWLAWRYAHWLLDDQGRLALGASWPKRRLWGTLAALAVAVGAAAALLYPFEFQAGSTLFKAKMDHFINWPFQLYYYVSEWHALNKVVTCMLLFAGSGLAMRWGWAGDRRQWQGLLWLMVIVLVVGMGVELGHGMSGRREVFTQDLDEGLGVGFGEQAIDITDNTLSKGKMFSVGKVADITDVLAYLAGAWAGWLAAGLVVNQGVSQTAASPVMKR